MAGPVEKSVLAAMLDSVEVGQEARDAIERLDERDLQLIDGAILTALDREWKQAGLITAGVMIAAPDEYEELPEAFYALRIRALAEAARIETRGDPAVLKTLQIRLAAQDER